MTNHINGYLRSPRVVAALLAAGLGLGGCATEDYVDKHIATVNQRIDDTNSRLEGVDGRVNALSGTVDNVQKTAQDALQAAGSAQQAAQAAAEEARIANDKLASLGTTVAHLERHHRMKTWRDVSTRRSVKRAPAKRRSR